MKTSKTIFMGLALLGMFYNGQAQEVKQEKKDSTKTQTITKKVELENIADLQKLLQGLLNTPASDSTKKDSTGTKKINLKVSSQEELQQLLKMLGGNVKIQVQEGEKPQAQAVKKDSINGRPAWWGKSVLNQKAPEIVAKRWITKEPNREGKFVILDSWSTFCGPCKQAIPKLNEWSKKFKNDLVIVGLAHDDTEKKDNGIEYYRAVDGGTFKPLDLRVLSYVLLIDPKGIVRWEGVCKDLTEVKLKEIIAKYK